jgi:hypothetical protein
LREDVGYGESHGDIFRVDEGCDFEGGFLVEIECGVVGLFGAKAAERRSGFQG